MAVLLQFGQAPGNIPFNPARATASALFSSPDALGQLWLFWVAPLVGAALAGLVFRGFAQHGMPRPPPRWPAAAAGDEETDQEEALLAEAGEEPGPDAEMPTAATRAPAATPSPAGRATGEDEARDFFDKRGQ